MPTIKKLKSGRYNVQIRKANQPSKSATFDTEDEAHLWIDQLNQPMELNRTRGSVERARSSNALIFMELAKRYCDTVLTERASYTIATRRLERIAKQLPCQIGAISKFDISDYRLKRLKQVSSVTCRDELQLINRVY